MPPTSMDGTGSMMHRPPPAASLNKQNVEGLVQLQRKSGPDESANGAVHQ